MSALETRLSRQLASKGVKDAKGTAIGILKSRGQMNADGSLTASGKQRQALGPDGRAKDRAAKASGGAHKASDYVYDKRTNRATLK
jgi:hypothetical protein